MKRLIAALVPVSLLLSSLPAYAGSVTSEQMVRRLSSLGVKLIEREVCYNKDNLATYNRGTNEFCMSSQVFSSPKHRILDVVAHESVHVIQDCLGGGLRSDGSGSIADFIVNSGIKSKEETTNMFLSRLKASGLNSHVKYVASKSPTTHHARREAEAYALQSSPDLIYKMLGEVCR